MSHIKIYDYVYKQFTKKKELSSEPFGPILELVF